MRLFHIIFHVGDGFKLILGFDVGERRFQFVLPRRIGAKRMTGGTGASGVQTKQFARFFLDGLSRPALDANPVLLAELVERRRAVVRPDIAREPIRLMDGHEQRIRPAILDQQVFAFHAFQRAAAHADELAHAVIDVHHIIAFVHVRIGEFGRLGAAHDLAAARFGATPAEDLGVGEQVHSRHRPPATASLLA